jgi:hypothetical protein
MKVFLGFSALTTGALASTDVAPASPALPLFDKLSEVSKAGKNADFTALNIQRDDL